MKDEKGKGLTLRQEKKAAEQKKFSVVQLQQLFPNCA